MTDEMVTTITAQDRRALANTREMVTFHLYNGQGSIHIHKDGARAADGFDQLHAIYTESTIHDYTPDTSYAFREDASNYGAFHSDMAYSDTYRTLIARIRIGDTLRLMWTMANDNDNNRAIGWHRDELRLRITHKNGNVESYLVGVSVGPDNSARMCKVARNRARV